jgi:hypothetical protein
MAASRDVAPGGIMTTFLTPRRAPVCVITTNVSSRALMCGATSAGFNGL